MSNRLYYASSYPELRVNVPNRLFDQVVESNGPLGPALDIPARRRALRVEDYGVGKQLVFETEKIGHMNKRNVRDQLSKGFIEVLDQIARMSHQAWRGKKDLLDYNDEALTIRMGSALSRDNVRYFVHGSIAWPGVRDTDIADQASEAMRHTAVAIGYATPDEVGALVGATVDRATGLSLNVNNPHGCRLETFPWHYKRDQPRATIEGVDLYSNQMQLVALSGIIAAVRARSSAAPDLLQDL